MMKRLLLGLWLFGALVPPALITENNWLFVVCFSLGIGYGIIGVVLMNKATSVEPLPVAKPYCPEEDDQGEYGMGGNWWKT